MFENICANVARCHRDILDATVELAVEIAREGREGRRIGTIFTLGAAEGVLANSRPLILDPIALQDAGGGDAILRRIECRGSG